MSPGLQLPSGFPARRATRGSFAGLSGRFGAFGVGLRGAGGGVEEVAADQVLLVVRDSPAIKTRTGVHVRVSPGAEALAAVSGALLAFIGDYMKSVAIRYDSAVCAGGSAGNQACGRCIPACPYQALSRDLANPLRIAIDRLACEGCGACTAACPTSALEFTEPSAAETLGRMAGLLGPAPGAPEPPLGLVFHCSREGRRALDAAAVRPRPYSAIMQPVEVPCLRHVSDALLLGAFRMAATDHAQQSQQIGRLAVIVFETFNATRPMMSRTHYLSLNAQIAAAKLGKQGLPFSGIAREMHETSTNIGQLIDEMEQAFHKIVAQAERWMASSAKRKLLGKAADLPAARPATTRRRSTWPWRSRTCST